MRELQEVMNLSSSVLSQRFLKELGNERRAASKEVTGSGKYIVNQILESIKVFVLLM